MKDRREFGRARRFQTAYKAPVLHACYKRSKYSDQLDSNMKSGLGIFCISYALAGSCNFSFSAGLRERTGGGATKSGTESASTGAIGLSCVSRASSVPVAQLVKVSTNPGPMSFHFVPMQHKHPRSKINECQGQALSVSLAKASQIIGIWHCVCTEAHPA